MKIVLNNIRSGWNVGAIMRTCDAIGADLVLVGYTPRPVGSTLKIIQKTAIGAEKTVSWNHFTCWQEVLENFQNYTQIGIEISKSSQNIFNFLKLSKIYTTEKKGFNQDYQLQSNFSTKGTTKIHTIYLDKTLLWFGNEIHGLEPSLCKQLDFELHLPMYGSKESLNVASTVCAVGYLLLSRVIE